MLADEQARARMRREAEHKIDFARWKLALDAFCDRVFAAIDAQAAVLTDHHICGDQATAERMFEQQCVLLRSLIPSEDLVLVLAAIGANAAALVTEDEKLLNGGGLSLDLNHKLAFVHPADLDEALRSNFVWRWKASPTRGR